MKLCTAEDGVYFNLPEAEYHALPRMSASGVQNMLVSPATFWARSWMNPHREEKEKKFQTIGKAYHTARLEPEKLTERFVRELTAEDIGEACLATDAEIKEALKDLGHAQTKAGEKVLDRAYRLRDAGYTGAIWHIEQAAFLAQVGDRDVIPAGVWDEIERDVAAIRRNPEVAEHLTDGDAEVSILWTDEATGTQFKARLDYLKPEQYTDFKTFDNSRGKHIDKAICDAMQFNRYYVQATVYWQAVELIRTENLPIQGEATEEQKKLHASVAIQPHPMRSVYVFQEKGGVPNIVVREVRLLVPHASFGAAETGVEEGQAEEVRRKYSGPSMLYRKAEAGIHYAARTFQTMLEIYGGDGSPWYPINPLGTVSDENFSLNWLESDW